MPANTKSKGFLFFPFWPQRQFIFERQMVSGNVRDAHESYLHCLGNRRMGGGQPKKWNILYLHGQPRAERVIYMGKAI